MYLPKEEIPDGLCSDFGRIVPKKNTVTSYKYFSFFLEQHFETVTKILGTK